MQYKFVTEQSDYSDLASGRVFHSLSGHPAFPVRLASEILQHCQSIRTAGGGIGPCVLYDPCCGAGYALSVLAYLHREMFSEVIGSDVDERAVTLAAQNLSLLNPAGLDQRIAQLEQLRAAYGKASHAEALTSAATLRERIVSLAPLPVRAFCASATDASAMAAGLRGSKADIVFADIPYGQHSQWQEAGDSPTQAMLTALIPLLSPNSIIAIASDKQQKITHAHYERAEHFQLGKRRVVILKAIR